MVIFHSYVSLPEGTSRYKLPSKQLEKPPQSQPSHKHVVSCCLVDEKKGHSFFSRHSQLSRLEYEYEAKNHTAKRFNVLVCI